MAYELRFHISVNISKYQNTIQTTKDKNRRVCTIRTCESE